VGEALGDEVLLESYGVLLSRKGNVSHVSKYGVRFRLSMRISKRELGPAGGA
jgi:hypothetical protein